LGTIADSLQALSSQVRGAKDSGVTPPVPESLKDTGIPDAVVEQLILKFLYNRGEMLGRELAGELGLDFSLIDDILESLKRSHAIGVRKSLGMGNSSGIFFLTDAGRATTREHMENNQYVGPVPVPISQYEDMVRRQRLKDNWLTPLTLKQAFSHLVVEQDILAKIGPAVNSNKSFLIYGQPGNGKNRPGRSSVQRRHRPRLYALRHRMPGQHHPGLRSHLPSEDRG
jgi:DNA-binding MarR family transcriptional regulator